MDALALIVKGKPAGGRLPDVAAPPSRPSPDVPAINGAGIGSSKAPGTGTPGVPAMPASGHRRNAVGRNVVRSTSGPLLSV